MLQYAVAPRGEDMEKFNRALRGYDPEEVNAFLDQVITQVEKMIAEGKEKDKKKSNGLMTDISATKSTSTLNSRVFSGKTKRAK